ncbi:hypothetical protein J8273_2290 [Carpediemonas membranifera]|uniref:BCNT-C domain-containing protein n=1 Tax=Carpediemonas membranifera TaxID=201153 RepID=A0A8J6AVN7_9EUKA|nr:hypothetical protein J8273_2290 [Carpediemonas membranifera]|eukprot:KAG9395941.1 hypothetical protein J8273_2290 [Carpediemonas membranifera]
METTMSAAELDYDSSEDEDYAPSPEEDLDIDMEANVDEDDETAKKGTKVASMRLKEKREARETVSMRKKTPKSTSGTIDKREKPNIAALMRKFRSGGTSSFAAKREETVTEASKKAWAEYKKKAGKEKDLEKALEGGFLQQQAFLQKADHAEWRSEIALRAANDKAKKKAALAAQR